MDGWIVSQVRMVNCQSSTIVKFLPSALQFVQTFLNMFNYFTTNNYTVSCSKSSTDLTVDNCRKKPFKSFVTMVPVGSPVALNPALFLSDQTLSEPAS